MEHNMENMDKDEPIQFFINPDSFPNLANLTKQELEARLSELNKKREGLTAFQNDATREDGILFTEIEDESHLIKLKLARLRREEKETAGSSS